MRIKLTHIALILSMIALVLSLFTAVQVSRSSTDALIDALMEQNRQLQLQVEALAQQTMLPEDTEVSAPVSATLTAVAWPDSQGADVTMILESTADEYCLLRVMQGNDVITEVPCQPDGDRYTATVQVPAGNGYTYSLIIGSESRTLSSPENPVYPELVYLADSLNAYCNLVVSEWSVQGNVLTLEAGYAQIQTPQLSASGALTCTQANLILKNGGKRMSKSDITLLPGEGPGSYESTVSATFRLPALAVGEQVELWLEATLSDGRILSVNAATWYVTEQGFTMSAG